MKHTESERDEFIQTEFRQAAYMLESKHPAMARILEIVAESWTDNDEIAAVCESEWQDEMSDRDRYEFDMNSARYEP